MPAVADVLAHRLHTDADALRAFAVRHRLAELALFGSVLRDDFRPADSDVDVLFTLLPDEEMSIEKYMAMEEELRSMFGGRAVHLVQKPLIRNPIRRRAILSSRQVIYAA